MRQVTGDVSIRIFLKSRELLGVIRPFCKKTQRAAEAHAVIAIKPSPDMKQALMVPHGEIRYRSWLHEALTLNEFIVLITL